MFNAEGVAYGLTKMGTIGQLREDVYSNQTNFTLQVALNRKVRMILPLCLPTNCLGGVHDVLDDLITIKCECE